FRPDVYFSAADPCTQRAWILTSRDSSGRLGLWFYPQNCWHGSCNPYSTCVSFAASPTNYRKRSIMKVREIMTDNPETVSPGTFVADVARMMRDLDVGIIPVVHEGQLKGVITDRDI